MYIVIRFDGCTRKQVGYKKLGWAKKAAEKSYDGKIYTVNDYGNLRPYDEGAK